MGNNSAVTGPEGGLCPLGSQMVEFRISRTRNIKRQAVLWAYLCAESGIKNWVSDHVLSLGRSFECVFLETHLLRSQWHYHEEIQNLGVLSLISATDQLCVLGLNLSLLIWTSGLLVFTFQRK